MKALQKFIVIKPIIEKKEPTTKGFQMSSKDQADNLYQEGLVVLAGEDLLINEGDRILYNQASGYELRLNGETVRMIQERDVAILLEEGDTFGN